MNMKKILRLALFTLLIAAMATIFFACDLGGGDKDKGKTKPVDVGAMQVVGEIEGDIYYDPDSETIKWNAVDGANTYYVKFGSGDNERKFVAPSSGIVPFTGDNEFSVFAVRDNNTKTAVKKQVFSTPELNIKIDKEHDAVTWTGDEGASGYTVTIRNADDNKDVKELTAEAGATSASLDYIKGDGKRYYVIVKMSVAKGTTIPCEESLNNIRRVQSAALYYNGYNRSFMNFPTPYLAENARYTNHITIGDETIECTGRSYEYIPTGGTFTASAYTSSNKDNYLNSTVQTITVTEKPSVTNLACDTNGVLTWDAVDGAESYDILLGGEKVVGVQTTSYAAIDVVNVGVLGEITVMPFFARNAYSAPSEVVKVFRKGSDIKLDFYTNESTYGQTGTNRFTASVNTHADTQIKGFLFRVTGAVESTFSRDLPENVRSIRYEDLNFETPGDYTVTITPLYDLDPEVTVLGEDKSDYYTVTRLPDLTSAEVRNANGTGRIYMTGVADSYVDVVDPSTNVRVSHVQPTVDGDEFYLGLIETNNTATMTRTYNYNLYNTASVVSSLGYTQTQRNSIRHMDLRSLNSLAVSYQLVGKVSDLSLTQDLCGLRWTYGAASFRITEPVSNLNLVSNTSSVDLSSQIEEGLFNDDEDHYFSVSVVPDPENNIFSPVGNVRIKVKGRPSPELFVYADTLNGLSLNNFSSCTVQTTYAAGPNAGQTLTGWVSTLTSDFAGATIRIRNTGAAANTITQNNFFPSPWVTYNVVLPDVTDTDIVCNSDKTVSWTAVSGISSYKYVISGGGDATADRVTANKTSSLASILSGRKTYTITVSGYGSQDGNVFYLPREILTDTFYCSSLEVWGLNNGEINPINNDYPHDAFDQETMQFRLKIVPDGSGIIFSSCSVTIRDSNGSMDPYYVPGGASTNSDFDCTTAVNNNFGTILNRIGLRHPYLVFQLSNSAESTLLSNKSFLDNSSVEFSIFKNYTNDGDSGRPLHYDLRLGRNH